MPRFKNLSLFNKIFAIIVFILFGYVASQSVLLYWYINSDFLEKKVAIIETQKDELTEKMTMVHEFVKQVYEDDTKIETIEKNYRPRLKQLVDTLLSSLEYQVNILRGQGISEPVIQEKLRKHLDGVRYDNGNGYFFAISLQGEAISHINHDVKNVLATEIHDINGKYFVKEFLNIANTPEQEGLTSYYWSKLGHETPQLKISYLKVFKPYNWIIGTGIYVEDTFPELQTKIAKLITSYFYDVGKSTKNYFTIVNEKGDVINSGGFPEYNGKNVWDLQDKDGYFIIRDMIRVARDSGSRNGFVEYWWNHPTDKENVAKKLTRVQWFEPFRWIIGTGVYIQDLGINDVHEKMQYKTYIIFRRIIFSSIIFLALGLILSISLVRSVTKPLTQAQLVVEEIAHGNFSREVKYDAKDEIGQLVKTLNSMSKKLQIAFHEIKHQNQELILLNQDKNEFLEIVSHDLRNPLSVILGASEEILNEHKNMSSDEIVDFSLMIKRSADRMFVIVANLLDMNILETGKIALRFESTNIVEILAKNIAMYQKKASDKKLNLYFSTDKAICLAMLDKDLIYQVFDNLISNAIKYSPVDQNKNIYVRLTTDETTVRCEVQDEGPGLSDDDQQKLFNKFQRLSAKPTAGEHSTGLGLFIVKKLVEAQHGRVWCESESGAGANFIAEFPLLN